MSIRPPSTFLQDGLVALIATAAAAGACATMWWIGLAVGAGGAACVLATVVALSLGRRVPASRREFARSAAILPVIGLAAGGVGWLLVAVPPAGAVLFTAGMSVAIWLRRFGPRAAHLGGLIPLPLTAALVAPVPPSPGVPIWVSAGLVLLAGVVAVLWVAVAREGARLVPTERERRGTDIARARVTPASAAPTGGGGRLPASTRMAVQMAVALAVAFAVGWAVFPAHALWVVLTAFLVCAGNRGRGDVLHKSAMRVLGAVGGTVGGVALIALIPGASGFGAVVALFVALFAGTWLRALSYAYWAAAATVALTILQELTGTAAVGTEAGLLAERLLAIVVGAAVGIAASWFVLPVRSTDVLRRRLSDLLVALGGAVAAGDTAAGDTAGDRPARVAAFRVAVVRVEQLAPPHLAARRIAGRRVRAMDCIDAAAALPAALDGRLARGASHPPTAEEREHLRSALTAARRSLAAPTDLASVRDALEELERVLRAQSG